jgi:Domain of unknown function (DUF1127)
MRNTPPLPAGAGFADPAWPATHRPQRWTDDVRAALQTITDAWQRHADEVRRRRQARANYLALFDLDAWTLRDLGLHRSELLSVVSEQSGTAEATRTRVALRQQELPF